MAKIRENHIFTGLQRDLSVSKHPIQFLYDGRNIRLTARENNSLLSITNERGTEDTGISINGQYVGHCLLNQYLVVFSTKFNPMTLSSVDYITRIDLSSGGTKVIYTGNSANNKDLNFSISNPIKAIGSYETETIQKVYWTDNRNQPRLINIIGKIVNGEETFDHYASPSMFDFVTELQLKEDISVIKIYGASGTFAPGVIQYAFTYFDKYGHESNIFYTTKLYCVSFKDRGASPEEKVNIAFKITVKNVDTNFDYLRIYSIQRTSKDAEPLCKRIQDIELLLGMNEVSYTDAGTSGDTVDPMELLYKGGEQIKVGTLEQKDNTLFLGDISITRQNVPDIVKEKLKDIFDPYNAIIDSDTWSTGTDYGRMYSTVQNFQADIVTKYDKKTSLSYINSIDFSGLKRREIYRFGVQFQHKTGKWSEPMWLRDYQINTAPSINNTSGILNLPHVKVEFYNKDAVDALINAGYKKARLLMTETNNTNRTILCQGISNPVLYTNKSRYAMRANGSPDYSKKGPLYAQASWIFRPGEKYYPFRYESSNADDGAGYIPSTGFLFDLKNLDGIIIGGKALASPYLRSTEIGSYSQWGAYQIDSYINTINTPELIFGEDLNTEDLSGTGLDKVGKILFETTYGDMDIQTKTPTIGSAQGFVHKVVKTNGNAALVSGLYYEDYVVDDWNDTPTYGKYNSEYMHVPVSWPVFMWHRSGSLNNDVNRDARSAELKEKKISNYHLSNTTEYLSMDSDDTDSVKSLYPKDIKVFDSDELSVIKVNECTYMGNIDTVFTPDGPDFKYFVGDPFRTAKNTNLNDNCFNKLGLKDPKDSKSRNGFWALAVIQENPSTGDQAKLIWTNYGGNWTHIGDYVSDLCVTSESIRIKYKSTPHLVANLGVFPIDGESELSMVEVTRAYDSTTLYGGMSADALKENVWIPISEPVRIVANSNINLVSSWGDTYFQRWDCLKTYAYTNEDINQVVDIASFMVESHCNLDGRYDRNRGQISNLNMSPRNYNLYNPVYSQRNNFFNYRIMDSDFYKNVNFPNQITWTKEKTAGADVDLWTNITLASTYDMDGSKGRVEELTTYKDQIYCFQDKGVSNILFNSRVQIPTSDGVPIEISNSYKVDGYRYLSDGIGCNKKELVKKTPAGIYFIDSVSSHLFHIGDGLMDISEQNNMTAWFKDNAGYIKKLLYDDIHHDVYAVLSDKVLGFSEKLNQFTGFYDYGAIDLIETCDHKTFTLHNSKLWNMFSGNYCNFFGVNKPWGFTFISNGQNEGQVNLSKTFTNIEFRANVGSDGELNQETGKFTPTLPLDSLEVWDEYQHGFTTLENKNGHSSMVHGGESSALLRKFRIWRCDIPRNNAYLDNDDNRPSDAPYSFDADLGISRKIRKPLDRMNNPWIYLKFQKEAANSNQYLEKTEIHDIVIDYYI